MRSYGNRWLRQYEKSEGVRKEREDLRRVAKARRLGVVYGAGAQRLTAVAAAAALGYATATVAATRATEALTEAQTAVSKPKRPVPAREAAKSRKAKAEAAPKVPRTRKKP